MGNVYEQRTECPLDGGLCGHICNALCTNGEHCDLAYSRDEDIEQVEFRLQVLPDRAHLGIQFSRVERAIDAPDFADNSLRHLYPRPDNMSAREYKYLVWYRGCPDDCPRVVGSREEG